MDVFWVPLKQFPRKKFRPTCESHESQLRPCTVVLGELCCRQTLRKADVSVWCFWMWLVKSHPFLMFCFDDFVWCFWMFSVWMWLLNPFILGRSPGNDHYISRVGAVHIWTQQSIWQKRVGRLSPKKRIYHPHGEVNNRDILAALDVVVRLFVKV